MPALATNALTTANAAAKPAAKAGNAAQTHGPDDSPFAAMLETAKPQAKSDNPSVKSNDTRQAHFRAADAKNTKSADIKSASPNGTKQTGTKADQNPVSKRGAKSGASDSANNRDGKTGNADENSAQPHASAGKKDDGHKNIASDPVSPAVHDDGAQPPVQAQQANDPTGQAAAQAVSLTTPTALPSAQMPANDPAGDGTISAGNSVKAATNSAPAAANMPPPADAGQDSDATDGVQEAPQPALLQPKPKPAGSENPIASAKADPAPVKDPHPAQSAISGDDESVAPKTDASANKDAAASIDGGRPAPAKTDAAPSQASTAGDDAAASPTPGQTQDTNPNAVAVSDTPAPAKMDAAQINALAGQNIAGNKSGTPATDAPQAGTIRAGQNNRDRNDKSLLAGNNAPPVHNVPVTPDNGAGNDKAGSAIPKDAVLNHGAAANGDKPESIKDSVPQSGDAQTARNSDLTSQAPLPAPIQPPAQQTIPANNAAIGIQAPQQAAAGSAPNITASIHVGPQAPDVAPNVNSLAVEIAAKSQSGAKQFDIRLDPPELGRVDVRLSIDASGKAQAHMTADQPQTLHLLQRDSDTLTRALRDAGLDVSQNGLNFSLRGQDRHAGDGHNNPRGTPSHILQATKTIEIVPTGNITYSSTGNARLDIHV